MANEITATATLSVEKSNLEMEKTISILVTMTGNAYHHGVQTIGTSDEQVIISGDIGTYGYCLLRNLDSTNYIEIGAVTLQYAIKLKAGEIALFRFAANGLFAKANTASCDLEVWLIED